MNFAPTNTEGIFAGLSEAEYRSAPGVSQSLLKAFDAEPTPKHFQESLTRPRVATESMEFGTILHAAILTPHLLAETYYVRPATYPPANKPWHGSATWCKDWLAEHSGRIIIDPEQEKAIPRIVETVMSLPVAGDIIRTGQKEVSFFKIDPETGLMLKCRVDAISTSQNGETFIVDPKKVQRGYAAPERFGVQCADYGYAIQAASYLSITGASRFIFVAMEEESPFEAACYELDSEDIFNGLTKWRSILLRYASAIEDGTWPGYERTVKKLKLPAWAKDRERPEAENIYI